MSARRSAAASPQPPHAAVGRADLLRFLQQETDAGLRVQAAVLLGLPPLPIGLFAARPPLPTAQSAAAAQAAGLQAAGALKLPLRCPVLLHARALQPEADEAGAAGRTNTQAAWTARDADEVETMLLPTPLQAPAQTPLVPFARRSGSVSRALRQPAGLALDWPALLRRVSQGQLLWPLPLRRQQRGLARLVVLIDTSPALGCFDDDFWGIALALGAAQGWTRTEVWLLPQGPTAPRQPAWGDMQHRPWDAETAVVLLSDLGAGRPAEDAKWPLQLRLWRRTCARLVAIVPSALHAVSASVRRQTTVVPLVAHTSPLLLSPAEQLRYLLAALSPALTVEPQLLRAMRLALLPGSSPLLERDVWCHPHLVGGLPFLQWLPKHQQAWLEALRQLDAGVLQTVDKVLRIQHPHLCPVQRDEEAMLLGSLAFASAPGCQTVATSSAHQSWHARYDDAQSRCVRVSRHLLHLQTQAVGSALSLQTPPAHSAGSKAAERLLRMPVALRSTGCAGANDLFAAQSLAVLGRADMDFEVPEGVAWTRPPESPPLPRQALAVELWQCGPALWLHAAQALGQEAPIGSCLWRCDDLGSWIKTECHGVRRVLAVSPQRLPMQLSGWRNLESDPLQLRWHGGAIEVLPVQRPLGVTAWGINGQGSIAAFIQSLRGRTVGSREGAAVAMPGPALQGKGLPRFSWLPTLERARDIDGVLVAGEPIAMADHTYGFDGHGAYVDLRLPARSRDGAVSGLAGVFQRLRYLQPGTFLMGSPTTEKDRDDDEGPQHHVTLTQGYWLADTPCTQALWMAVMGGANPSHFKDGADAAQCPVENVSWNDIQGFLKRLQAQLPPGCVAVLPSEAQWEYAARAGTATAYFWGDEADLQRANFDGAVGRTTAVNRYEPNPWGLHDMHGNVWEWCVDSVRSYSGKPAVNPTGDVSERARARVLRGGSWGIPAVGVRAAYRLVYVRGLAGHDYGFRLALRSPSPGPGGPGVSGLGRPGFSAGPQPAQPAAGSRKAAPIKPKKP